MPSLDKAYGYQGSTTNLPVPDLDSALPFYESVLGFRIVSRSDGPQKSAVIGRDGIGCEPASATTLAGIRELREAGQIDREAIIAAVLTGHALKDTDYIIQSQKERELRETAEVPVH